MEGKEQGNSVRIQAGPSYRRSFFDERYHKKYFLMETFDKFEACGL
jgi:hypothetical protein